MVFSRGRANDEPATYALGTANKNLPAFVNIGRPSSPVQLTAGYLGASSERSFFHAPPRKFG